MSISFALIRSQNITIDIKMHITALIGERNCLKSNHTFDHTAEGEERDKGKEKAALPIHAHYELHS